MRRMTTALLLGLAIAAPVAGDASADGPVRRGNLLIFNAKPDDAPQVTVLRGSSAGQRVAAASSREPASQISAGEVLWVVDAEGAVTGCELAERRGSKRSRVRCSTAALTR